MWIFQDDLVFSEASLCKFGSKFITVREANARLSQSINCCCWHLWPKSRATEEPVWHRMTPEPGSITQTGWINIIISMFYCIVQEKNTSSMFACSSHFIPCLTLLAIIACLTTCKLLLQLLTLFILYFIFILFYFFTPLFYSFPYCTICLHLIL